MPVAIPATRPKLSREEVEKIISIYNVDRDKYKVIVVGIRGYYLNAIGKANANDRGVYDDACFIVTPDYFGAFNYNTDPSSYRKGYGFGDKKGMAVVKPGVSFAWLLDYHKGKYMALCQRAGEMTVIRDGVNGPYEHTSKWIGANWHKGGINSTLSEGCQTIPPEQWEEAISIVLEEMGKHYGLKYKQTIVPYCLIEEEQRRKL